MPNEKWEITIYKTLHRKQKIAQHEPGVFRVKNHDFTQKNHIFSNFRGERAPAASPGSAPVNQRLLLKSTAIRI